MSAKIGLFPKDLVRILFITRRPETNAANAPGTAQTLGSSKISRQKKLENRLEYQIGWEPSTVPSGDWVVETTTSLCVGSVCRLVGQW